MKHLKLAGCGLILFIALGPLVGLLASGVIPMLAYIIGAMPAALAGMLLVLLRLSLDAGISRWQQNWPRWRLLALAALPGALIGGVVTVYYSRWLQPALYDPLFNYYVGAVAGGVCNALFWQLRSQAEPEG
ncbi:hypothetical protein EAY64_19405 [Aquitalea palustris]|uniref:Uncharacterized protein n=1 Tax=Aquitalea palustris TaxID=2480983 RepID=A0A454JD68_9NEIS|nr:hypothetical protein [Aquitalea palustris]RMC91288.1 hypothetical protein EAY64_19405 [Aquitalea palustris]